MSNEIQPEWAVRMERKLDALIEALGEELVEERPATARDLDGQPLFGERDTSLPL